jgi:hypothetical protein
VLGRNDPGIGDGRVQGREGDSVTPRKPVESVDIKRPMPTLSTGSATMSIATKSREGPFPFPFPTGCKGGGKRETGKADQRGVGRV